MGQHGACVVTELADTTAAQSTAVRPQTLRFAAAVTAAALVAATTAATIVLGIGVGDDLALYGPIVGVFAVVPALIGVAIVAKRPGNVIGWLLLAHGLFVALVMFTDRYAAYALVEDPGSLPAARWAALWTTAAWPTLFVGVAAIAFVMPDGRFLSKRWRRRGILSAVAFAGLLAMMLLGPDFEGDLKDVESPLPELHGAVEPLSMLFVLAGLAALITAAAAVRARFRASDGTTRLQLLWFANAALLIPAALIVCLLDVVIPGDTDFLTFAAVAVAGTAVPVCIGIAVLKHGLWDIELVLSRTLVYGTLTLGVVAVYFVLVAGVGSLIDSRSAAGLLAVALVAVGADPLRATLQRRVDRVVFGDRRTPYAALRRLTDRLQQTLAPGQVLQTVVDSVAEALRLPYVTIELDRDSGPEVAAAHGVHGRGELVAIPLTYQGEAVGDLVVQVPPGRDLARADRDLLSDLAVHAGVAVHAVRLTADLQRSRERLITAREEERRRLRRDLHDGLGPDLAAIALRLDAAQGMAGATPVGELIGELRDETREAIGGIRRIVDELRPPALDELGLVSALSEHTSRFSTPAEGNGASPFVVRVAGPDPAPALPAAVEVAAYRIALEAMTNAARHAEARSCDVRIMVNGALELEVADDGRGLPANPVAGVGLGSMRERAAEVGGSCTITTSQDGGTIVRAVLPLDRS